ncbi:MAG: hypothetical protein PHD21_07645 [Flavobacteriales bacterium]|nr:hypothetical protein [Flavobacteriales bacterium]
MKEYLGFISLILTLITAATSVWFTLRHQRILKKNADFLLFEKYNDAYFNEDLGIAFRTLGSLKASKEQKAGIDPEKLNRWCALMSTVDKSEITEQDKKWMSDIDSARRKVKSYYHKLAMLHQYEVIGEDKIFTLCEKGGVYLYLNIAWVLDKKQYPQSPDMKYFESIDYIVKKNEQSKA